MALVDEMLALQAWDSSVNPKPPFKKLGVVAHAYNPNAGKTRRFQKLAASRPVLIGKTKVPVRDCLKKSG